MNALNHDFQNSTALATVLAFPGSFAPANDDTIPGDPAADIAGPFDFIPAADIVAAPVAVVAGPATAVINRAELTRAFDIVSTVIERRNTIPILSNASIKSDGDSVIVTGTDLDMEIAVKVAGAARYVLDFIDTAGGDEITLTLGDFGSPTLITTPSREGWLGVLMPMRV